MPQPPGTSRTDGTPAIHRAVPPTERLPAPPTLPRATNDTGDTPATPRRHRRHSGNTGDTPAARQPGSPAAHRRHARPLLRRRRGLVGTRPAERHDTPRWRRHYSRGVAEEFDVTAMIERFRARARAVRERGIPPIEGPERQRFIDQAQLDYMDYAMLGDADAELRDGILTLSLDLRPPDQRG